jgi:serine/threonine-protein kinase
MTSDADRPTGEAVAADLSGSTVGRFVVGPRLGAGGMGEVYRAEDTQLRRTVAIKRLTPRSKDAVPSSRDLLREAQRASALNHPGIASVYDVLTMGDERFLVMEYVDGITLRERLASPTSVAEFCAIGAQCADALGAAHKKGILHGDLKPANIMLTRDGGNVKICDFGLARRLPRAGLSADTTSTVRHGITGTPAYMAPEVLFERPVDHRADIFSLGVVFYEFLSGRNPFAGDSLAATLDRVQHHAPESLDRVQPDVPGRLARLVHGMLEKDPVRRVGDALDVATELSSIRSQLARAGARRRLSRRLRLALPLAAAALLATVAAPRVQEWWASASPAASLPTDINLAVLPFTVIGGDDKRFFAEGLSDRLNDQLSRLTVNRRFQVATVSDRRARGVTSVAEAREQLGSNVVATGELRYVGSLVRISARLIETQSGRALRTETFDADSGDPLAVQDGIVNLVVEMLGLDLAQGEQAELAAHDTTEPGAYDFYLQGQGYLLNYDRAENLESAIVVFRRALEIDPRYALAYAGLGQAYWRRHELTGAAAWVDPARAACEGALGIDPNLTEPHACLGMVLNGTGEYERAAEEFGRALGREPTNDLLYLGLATAYERLGRHEDAEGTYRRAIDLRPHYWAGYNNLGAYYYRLGRFDDALSMFQQVVALVPDSFRGYSSLGAVHFMMDSTAEAIAAFQKSLDIRPNYAAASNLGTLYYFDAQPRRAANLFQQALGLEQGSYQVWGNLAQALEDAGDGKEALTAYARARDLARERLDVNAKDAALHMAVAEFSAALGDVDAARSSLDQVLRLAPTDGHTLFQLATFYEARLGERDRALAWLARALEEGQTWREIDSAPPLRALRADPRFLGMRRRGVATEASEP